MIEIESVGEDPYLAGQLVVARISPEANALVESKSHLHLGDCVKTNNPGTVPERSGDDS